MRRKKPTSQEPVLLTIDALSHEGRGIATHNGKKVFVFGGLPGEIVSAKYTLIKKGYDEAEVIEVHKPSKDRVEPTCAYFGDCGGCKLQHLDPTIARAHKQQTVLDNLKHMGGVAPESIVEPIYAETEGYRRKARLGVRYVFKKEELLVGFRELKSNRVAIMDSCKILDSRIGNLIAPLKTLIGSLAARETIPQIEVAMGDEVASIIVRHLDPLCEQDTTALKAFCKEFNLALYLQPKGPASVHKIWPEDNEIYLSYHLEEQNITFKFHPLDFTQVNAQTNKQMITQALQWLDVKSSDKVLDLFCGIGNFTLPIAKQADYVVGIEGSESAIERANMNAKLNNIQNTEFHVQDLFKPITSLAWAKKQYNKILLDPARTGAEDVIKNINLWNPERIVYVSCNPATFARDAGILVKEHGYRLVQLGIIDMFTHTAHVETMALFMK